MEKEKLSIAIIGYGHFGKLLAFLLKPFGQVFIVDQRRLKEVQQIRISELGNMDWIILSVPISAMEEVLTKIKPFLKKSSLVMDVCSVKVWPSRLMKKILPRDIEIIATHPMFGPDSAKQGLKGAQIVVCPVMAKNKTLKQVLTVFGKMKLNSIITTPEDHDRQAAVSLGLVHFIGRGLAGAGVQKNKISTLGFERLLAVYESVNNDTWQLFLDMHRFNPYAGKVRKDFRQALKKLEDDIKNHN